MHNPSRDIGRQFKKPRVVNTVAATSSPVTEPPRAPAAPAAGSASSLSGRTRPRGARSVAYRGPEPVIPLPSPVRQPPARITPLVLFLSQTLLDMAAIAGAFILAYWLRFYTDIIPRFAPPD